MLLSSQPPKFTIPWANSAGGGFIRPIPVASQIGITPGAASLTDGFPPLTFLSTAAGGVNPFGQDANGILNQTTAWSRWYSAGGPIAYDSVFSAAVGGYPVGAILGSTPPGGIWMSIVDGNTTNPDASGAGWVSLSAGRLIDVQVFNTAGSYTYAPAASVGMIEVEGCGGAGAGGGTVATGVGQVAVGGGAGAGAQGKTRIIGASSFISAAIVIGAGGAAVSGGNGGNGIATSFGAFLVLPGGGGGIVGAALTPPFLNGGGNGAAVATATGGLPQILIGGEEGDVGIAMTTGNIASGSGGSCLPYGTGGQRSAPGAGSSGTGNGAGGSGAGALASTGAMAGGAGLSGKLIIRGYSF